MTDDGNEEDQTTFRKSPVCPIVVLAVLALVVGLIVVFVRSLLN